MVKSLGKSIIRMYSMGSCAVLGMSNKDVLSEDLESDPFLTSTFQRFMCEYANYRFGSFLAPLNLELLPAGITCPNKMLQVTKMETRKETSEWLATPS